MLTSGGTDFTNNFLRINRRPGCYSPRSGRTASSLENKCMDAVHYRPPTL